MRFFFPMAVVFYWLILVPALRAADPAPTATNVAEFVYKETPQGELKLFVDFPPGWQATDKRPSIVFFFGGGWTRGTTSQFEKQAAYLASRSMVACRADYRVKSRHNVTPDQCVEDAKSAVRWIRNRAEKLGIDSNRIVAAGGSAGGHLAACTGTVVGLETSSEELTVSSRPNAMVLFNPVVNLSGAHLADRVRGKEEIARQISPTLHLTKETPPAILFFGSNDQLMPQGEEYVTKAKELGVRADWYLADGQSHGFFNRSPWQERTLLRVDEFLTSIGYLSGKPTLELP